MAKKSNQTRPDGRIAVQVYLGMVEGKRKYKVVYGKTQKEANQKAEELKARLRKGMTIADDRDSFSAWADFFLVSKSLDVGENQYQLIENRLQYWRRALGGYRIDSIRPMDIEPHVKSLADFNPHTRKPTAKNTLKAYMQILCGVFDYAIDNRVIEHNPASRIKLPKTAPQAQRRALTTEEQRRVMEFEHRGKTAIMLLMLSGLRRGEATALTWSDIDFNQKTISVTKSYDFKQGKIKPPKNGKPRTVSVPDILIEYLQTVPKTSLLVLTGQRGNMMTESAWKRLLESYLFDMNLKYGNFKNPHKKFAPQKTPFVIERFTLHCLRHTFCSMMYNAGVDVLTAQEQMGHSDVKTTLEIYTHLDKARRNSDIEALNNTINKMCKSDASQDCSKTLDA